MIMTITPMVHRGRRLRWVYCYVLHVAGAGAGGVAVVSALWVGFRSIGLEASSRVSLLVAMCLLAAAIMLDTRVVKRKPPSTQWQVPRRLRERVKPEVAALGYGLGLGVGVFTRVYFASVYAVFAVAALVLPFTFAVAVGMAYGTARGLGTWRGGRILRFDDLHEEVKRREHWRMWVRPSNVAVELVLLVTTVSMYMKYG
jgi:hypothetical protein